MNLAQNLGYPKDSKLLIVHADDAGLSHSQNRATVKALEMGMVNSYSIMVPCPWFYEIAVFAKNNPQFDNGIHLTLTCEWENYKFGPVLPPSEVSSLVDANGHFYKKREQLNSYASIEDVRKELEAQIDKAIRFGLKPTHLDSHMYSVGCNPEIYQIYKDLGKRYGLPVLIGKQLMEMVGLDPERNLNEDDFVIDEAYYGSMELFQTGKLGDYYTHVLKNMVSGLSIILIHPAFDDDEMKGITVNHPNFGSEWRQIDYEYFSEKKHMALVNELNINLITWKDVKIMESNLK